MLHPPSLLGKHLHVFDFKCKSVNFDNLFRNKIFGLQLFFSKELFPIYVSGILQTLLKEYKEL